MLPDYSAEGIHPGQCRTIPWRTPPMPHQLTYLQRYGGARAAALFCQMGTGKTWMLINNYAGLLAAGKVRHMIVIAPNGVHTSWERLEIPKHLPALPQEVQTSCLPNSGKKGKTVQDAFSSFMSRAAAGRPSVLLLSWSQLQGGNALNTALQFAALAPCMVVLDESDCMKNPRAARARAALALGRSPKVCYRRIATGTPASNGPFDLYMQLRFLSEELPQARSYTDFTMQYGVFLPDDHPMLRAVRQRTGARGLRLQAKDAAGVPLYQNLDKLKKIVSKVAFVMTKDDALQLPPKMYQTVTVEMTARQRAVYDRLYKEGVVRFHDEDVPLADKAGLLMALCQVCGNHYPACLSGTDKIKGTIVETGERYSRPAEEGDEIDPEHNPRLAALQSLLRSLIREGRSVIVWARFLTEVRDIAESIEQEAAYQQSMLRVRRHAVTRVITGATPAAERAAAIDDMQQRRCCILIATAAAAGVGHTLTACSAAIYYSNSFSLRDRLQSEDRIHRAGQTQQCLYYDIVMRDSVDEKIAAALQAKQEIQEGFYRTL